MIASSFSLRRRALLLGAASAACLAVAGCQTTEGGVRTGTLNPADMAKNASVVALGPDRIRVEVRENFRRDVWAGEPSLDPYWDAVTAATLMAVAREARARGKDEMLIQDDDSDLGGRGRTNGTSWKNVRIHARRSLIVNFRLEDESPEWSRYTVAELDANAQILAAQ